MMHKGPNNRRLWDQVEEQRPEELESSLGSVMDSVRCMGHVI